MAEDKAKPQEKPFPLAVNAAKGEAGLWVGKVPLVVAATMQGLSNLSTRLQCRSLQELFTRLTGVEVAATAAGIELLTVKGDRAAAIDALRLHHFGACKDAFAAILAHHFDEDDAGNGEAADEAA